jgi:hypothetical protein
MQIQILNLENFQGAKRWAYTASIITQALEGHARRSNDNPGWCYGTLGPLQKGDNPLTLNLEKISHRFGNLHLDGNVLVGDLVILNRAPCGQTLQMLMDIDPGMIQFEMRGLHNCNHLGELEWFELASIAAISIPVVG